MIVTMRFLEDVFMCDGAGCPSGWVALHFFDPNCGLMAQLNGWIQARPAQKCSYNLHSNAFVGNTCTGVGAYVQLIVCIL